MYHSDICVLGAEYIFPGCFDFLCFGPSELTGDWCLTHMGGTSTSIPSPDLRQHFLLDINTGQSFKALGQLNSCLYEAENELKFENE